MEALAGVLRAGTVAVEGKDTVKRGERYWEKSRGETKWCNKGKVRLLGSCWIGVKFYGSFLLGSFPSDNGLKVQYSNFVRWHNALFCNKYIPFLRIVSKYVYIIDPRNHKVPNGYSLWVSRM